MVNILRNCQFFSKWLNEPFYIFFSSACWSNFSISIVSFVILLIKGVLVGVKWIFTVVLVSISPVTIMMLSSFHVLIHQL